MRLFVLSCALMTCSVPTLATEITYRCGNGSNIHVDYFGPVLDLNLATLSLEASDKDEKKITLVQQPAASGSLYTNEEFIWHTKGREALLKNKTGSNTYISCVASS